MPTISMFYGIIIRMYFAPGEHPPPHFHVYYAEHKATVDIRTCEVIEGDPSREADETCSGVGGTASGRANGRLEVSDEWRRAVQNSTSSIRSETMYPSVKEVVAGPDYVLSIVFDNGEHGVLDMKEVLDFGVFQRIKSYEAFRQVRVAFDTIAWDCGVDLDPEFVYAKCKGSMTGQ